MFSQNQQIGNYQLLRKLGKGGFGEVWLAIKHSQLVSKKVAIKLSHKEDVNLETIRKEVLLWEQACGHSNVLNLIDADIYNDQIFIVSEYAKDGSLHDRLKIEGKLPVKKAIEMTIGILNGLEHLHSKRIIHRDIKPQNILLQGEIPRLADFGISRTMQTGNLHSTQIIGTPSYMSPEAFEGRRDAQTDIWSVGVVLYQLLSGTLPFSQENPSERMFAIMNREFPPLADEIPPLLKNIIKKALEKSPQNRYQTANQMREDLVKVLWSEKISEQTITEIEIQVPAKSIRPQPQIEDTTNLPSFAQVKPESKFRKLRNWTIAASLLLLLGVAAIPFLPLNSIPEKSAQTTLNNPKTTNSNSNNDIKIKNKK